jgi:hypothetical protein
MSKITEIKLVGQPIFIISKLLQQKDKVNFIFTKNSIDEYAQGYQCGGRNWYIKFKEKNSTRRAKCHRGSPYNKGEMKCLVWNSDISWAGSCLTLKPSCFSTFKRFYFPNLHLYRYG